jgi:hypothetical protein
VISMRSTPREPSSWEGYVDVDVALALGVSSLNG